MTWKSIFTKNKYKYDDMQKKWSLFNDKIIKENSKIFGNWNDTWNLSTQARIQEKN